jgi:hypothetical protein
MDFIAVEVEAAAGVVATMTMKRSKLQHSNNILPH